MTRDRLRSLEARVRPAAAVLLVLSLLGHVAWLLTRSGPPMNDLTVYRDAAPSVLRGTLYSWRLGGGQFEQQPLLFTYPPFAALVFLVLRIAPVTVIRCGWDLLSLACLWWLVRLSLRLIAQHRPQPRVADTLWRRRAMLGTAVALWIEPVLSTLHFGQINLVLAAVVLFGLSRAGSLTAGLSVGVTAGIKLTPALSALYFLATRRWWAAVASAAAFALTVLAGYLVSPAQSVRYWLHLLGQTDRIGPVTSVINQSLRGALSRTAGHDVGSGPLWLAGVVVSAVLLGWALRAALRAGDVLAGVIAVQLFTLLVSPVSWSHHWVWFVPALLWLGYGPARGRFRALAGFFCLLAVASSVVSLLYGAEAGGLPWYGVALGWVYPACAVLILIAVGVTPPVTSRSGTSDPAPAAR